MASFSKLPCHIKENVFSKIRIRDLYEVSVVSEQWWWFTVESLKGNLSEDGQLIKILLAFFNRQKQLSTPLTWFELVKYCDYTRVQLNYVPDPTVLSAFLESRKPIRYLCLRNDSHRANLEKAKLASILKYFPDLKQLKLHNFALSPSCSIPKRIQKVHLSRITVDEVAWSDLFEDPVSIKSLQLQVNGGLIFDRIVVKNLERLSLHFETPLAGPDMRAILVLIRFHKCLKSVKLVRAKITKEWFNLFGETIESISLKELHIEDELLRELGNDGCYERRLMSYLCTDFRAVKQFTLAHISTEIEGGLDLNQQHANFDDGLEELVQLLDFDDGLEALVQHAAFDDGLEEFGPHANFNDGLEEFGPHANFDDGLEDLVHQANFDDGLEEFGQHANFDHGLEELEQLLEELGQHVDIDEGPEENEEDADLDYSGYYTCRPQLMEEKLSLSLSRYFSRQVQTITTTDAGPALRDLSITYTNVKAELLTDCVPAFVKKLYLRLIGDLENLSIGQLCKQPENLEELTLFSCNAITSFPIQRHCFTSCTRLKVLKMTFVNRKGIRNILKQCVSLEKLTLYEPKIGCFTHLRPSIASKTIRELNLHLSYVQLEDIVHLFPNLEVLALSSHRISPKSVPTAIAKLKRFSATFDRFSNVDYIYANLAFVMATVDVPCKLFYSDLDNKSFTLHMGWNNSIMNDFNGTGGYAYCCGLPTRYLKASGIEVYGDVEQFYNIFAIFSK